MSIHTALILGLLVALSLASYEAFAWRVRADQANAEEIETAFQLAVTKARVLVAEAEIARLRRVNARLGGVADRTTDHEWGNLLAAVQSIGDDIPAQRQPGEAS